MNTMLNVPVTYLLTLKIGDVSRVPLSAWTPFSSKIMLHRGWRWFSVKTPKIFIFTICAMLKGNESTGLKNETHVTKTQISPILSNRANVLLSWKCKLGLPLEDRGKKKKKRRKGLGANEQTHIWLLCWVVRQELVGGRIDELSQYDK